MSEPLDLDRADKMARGLAMMGLVGDANQMRALIAEVERLRADAANAREQRAAALREAADAALDHYGTWGGAGWADWLNERADRIEATP